MIPSLSAPQVDIFNKAMLAIQAMAPKTPALLGPNGKPLPPSSAYSYSRSAAKRSGSMKNWVPQRLVSRQSEAMEREAIVVRSVDLVNSDPHAAGIADGMATNIIGSGLTPHPLLDREILGLDKKQIRLLRGQMRSVFRVWSPFADAGGRMNFGALTWLIERCLMKFGEYLVLLLMIDDPSRPYSLACQVINPLRLRTPIDKTNDPNVRDGIEMGANGESKYFWIKKVDAGNPARYMMDTSENFMRIEAKRGHRWRVLHGFVSQDPEQVRGMPFFAPAMKFFRDLNDLLDAELVSAIVTAALAYFIEVPAGANPYDWANNAQDDSTAYYDSGGKEKNVRYQNVTPGQIMYGNKGEKPNILSASRPGNTFDPFVKTIKKSLAMALNMPYPVLFKDPENVNFAGFRSAMLDAWKVIMFRRDLRGADFNQPIYEMLMEEAHVRGHLDYAEFYSKRHFVTQAEWRGAPKGDIEPVKATQANTLKHRAKHKTLAAIIAEEDGKSDIYDVLDQLEVEEEELRERRLAIDGGPNKGAGGGGKGSVEDIAAAVADELEEREP